MDLSEAPPDRVGNVFNRHTGPDPFLTGIVRPAYREDPYPFLAKVRERQPVLRTADGVVVLTRYDDVTRALSDPRMGNTPAGAYGAVSGIRHLAGAQLPRPISMVDPPAHARVRRLLGAAFNRQTLSYARPLVARMVDQTLDAAARCDDVVDAVTQLALPVPLGVVCHLFDIPAGDRPRLVAWGRAMVANGDPDVVVTDGQRSAARRAEREFGGYIARLVLKRRRTPGDDLVSALARADVDGEHLTIDELIANAGFFFVNGYHNTVNLVANGLLALLRHPDQLARMRRDPSVVPNAVQELLRYDSPIQSIARVARERYVVGGQRLEPGTAVMAMVAAAHRDPAVFPDPDTLRVDRPLPQRVLSFGAGPHYCIGAALARSEVELLFTEIVRRFPGISLAGPPEWAPTFTLRGLDRLPVRLHP